MIYNSSWLRRIRLCLTISDGIDNDSTHDGADVHVNLKKRYFLILLYADDTVIIAESIQEFQLALLIVTVWNLKR